MNVLGTHLHQCTSWRCCERLCLASVNFFWRLFQRTCPFHDGRFTSAPAHTALSAQQFVTKNVRPLCPTLPIHLISPWAIYRFPDEKSLQGETFCWCGRGKKKKKSRSTKRHQNWRVQKLFWAVEIGVLHQTYFEVLGVLWRWLKFKHVRINIIFINKFCFGGPTLV